LFIKFAESTEIFLPIFQFGCLTAFSGVIVFWTLIGELRSGPPEAVSTISSISSFEYSLVKFHIEKCSESIGINLVLCLLNFYFIKYQAQIMDSLFAIPIVLLNFITSKVGLRPSKPDIAHIV